MSKPLALIVEDDPERAAALQESAEATGFSVEIVRDGWTALMRLARLTPNLVILKPLLPVVSGAEIAAHIRAGGHHLETKILMVSSSPVSGRARDLADQVVEGPMRDRDLRRALRPLSKALQVGQPVQTAGHPPLSSAPQIA